MGKKYVIDGTSVVGTVNKTTLTLIGGTTIRPEIYDILMSSGNADDVQNQWIIQRFTTDGTGVVRAPRPTDFDEVAATATAKENYSAAPTYVSTGVMLRVFVNARASERWVTHDRPFKVPDVSGNGIGFQAIDPSFTGITACTAYFEE